MCWCWYSNFIFKICFILKKYLLEYSGNLYQWVSVIFHCLTVKKFFTVSPSDSLPTDSGLESILYLACSQKDFMCKIICKYRHTSCTLAASNLIFLQNLQFVQSSTWGYAIFQVFQLSLFAKITVCHIKMLMFSKLYFKPKKLRLIILCTTFLKSFYTYVFKLNYQFIPKKCLISKYFIGK